MPYRDPFARRLEEDRKLRRHAGTLLADLLDLTMCEVTLLFTDVRALIALHEGLAIDRPISPEACCLYSRLGGTPVDKRRIVRLLELWLRYIETGVLNVGDSRELALITGNDDMAQSPHLDMDENPNAKEVLVAPLPTFRLISNGD